MGNAKSNKKEEVLDKVTSVSKKGKYSYMLDNVKHEYGIQGISINYFEKSKNQNYFEMTNTINNVYAVNWENLGKETITHGKCIALPLQIDFLHLESRYKHESPQMYSFWALGKAK